MEIGQRVRIKPEELDGFTSETRRKCKNGRIGIITGMIYNFGDPIYTLTFPAEGRMREYKMEHCREAWLEIVKGE